MNPETDARTGAYALPAGKAQAVLNFSGAVLARAEPLVEELIEAGLDEAQASNVIVNVLLTVGCRLAILIRRDMLDGTPSRDLWLEYTAEIFDRELQKIGARQPGDASENPTGDQ